MEAFYLKVYLFHSYDRVPPIKLARNSQLPIVIELMDYTIPEGSTASAFSTGSYNGKIYTQPCTVEGNRVIFTPQIGFFVPGRNSLQYLINDGVIPLAIDVYCEMSLPDGGEAVTPEEVLPYITRAENAAKSSEDSKKAAEESKAAAAGSAEAADQSAKDAAVSAEEAGNAANAAGQAKEAAEQRAEEAGNAASAAGQAKEAAEQSAEDAGNAANAAEESAAAALKSKNDANTILQSTIEQANKVEEAAARAEEVKNSLPDDYLTLITRLKSGAIEDAELHLGFYLDADGDLCQKED